MTNGMTNEWRQSSPSLSSSSSTFLSSLPSWSMVTVEMGWRGLFWNKIWIMVIIILIILSQLSSRWHWLIIVEWTWVEWAALIEIHGNHDWHPLLSQNCANIIIIIIIIIFLLSSHQKIIIISITDETVGVQGQKRLHALLFLWNRIGREPTAYAKVLGAPSEKVELGTARTTNCYLHLNGLHLHLLSATGKQHCPTFLPDAFNRLQSFLQRKHDSAPLTACLPACQPLFIKLSSHLLPFSSGRVHQRQMSSCSYNILVVFFFFKLA